MKNGTIWWSRIGNSLKLLDAVTDHLRDCRTAVLHLSPRLPWRQDFYAALDARRSSFGCDRRLIRLPWSQGADPGAFVLNQLCDDDVIAGYWPGESYAEYLGARDDIALCDCFVWITGIHSKSDLSRWCEFLRQYGSAEPEQKAVFLLEYDGEGVEHPGIDRICYTVEPYDCRVFCLETATLDNAALRGYQAELALRIGGGDPEFCAALLAQGPGLLQDPVRAAEAACAALTSDGRPFPHLPEQQIASAALKAAIVLLFPSLEQYRLDFVTKYQVELARHLPICNSNGDRVTDPFDLEIGPLNHILGLAGNAIAPQDAENIRLCRRVRNLLAHNKTVPCPDIRRVLEL